MAEKWFSPRMDTHVWYFVQICISFALFPEAWSVPYTWSATLDLNFEGKAPAWRTSTMWRAFKWKKKNEWQVLLEIGTDSQQPCNFPSLLKSLNVHLPAHQIPNGSVKDSHRVILFWFTADRENWRGEQMNGELGEGDERVSGGWRGERMQMMEGEETVSEESSVNSNSVSTQFIHTPPSAIKLPIWINIFILAVSCKKKNCWKRSRERQFTKIRTPARYLIKTTTDTKTTEWKLNLIYLVLFFI